ncbi:hypothetical protein CHARACLAT_017268, partial [Characodon lateralis]|nr:hypothetical protein [Characodon lateralis]
MELDPGTFWINPISLCLCFRLSFSGIFRSASRDSNQQPSTLSPVTIKLFGRKRREKSRAHSLSSPPLPPPASPPPPSHQKDVSDFHLETYLTEPQRPETRRLRSYSSPPDSGQRPSHLPSFSFIASSTGSQLPPQAPPPPASPPIRRQ